MKAVPILLFTNVLALAGVVFLALQQEDLKDQVGGRRADRDAPDPALMARLHDLETQLQGMRDATGPVTLEKNDRSITAEEPETAGGGEEPTFPEERLGSDGGETKAEDGVAMADKDMEVFRKKVQKANELNRQEEQVNRIADRIKGLVDDGRVTNITKVQRDRAAKTLFSYNGRIRNVWRKVMGDPKNRELSWPERRELVEAETEVVRTDAQKELEAFLTASDAEILTKEAMRGFGRGRGR